MQGRYKFFMFILAILFSVNLVSANIMCYQSNASVVNCGAQAGSYYTNTGSAPSGWHANAPFINVIDNSLATYGNASIITGWTNFTYYIPPYASNNYSYIQVKHGGVPAINLTINVSGKSTNTPNFIKGYLESTSNGLDTFISYVNIYNTSGKWSTISYSPSTTDKTYSYWYDFGFWWNLSIEPIYPINGSTIQSPQVNVTYPIWDGNYYDYENISIFYDDNFKRKINKSTFSFCQQDSFTTSSNCGNSNNASCWIESGTSAWSGGGAGTCGYDSSYGIPLSGTAYEYYNITSNIYSQGIKNNSLITLSYYKYGGLGSCGGSGYTYYLINKTINNTCFNSSMRFNVTVMRPIVNGQTQGIYLQCLNSSAGWTTIYSDTWSAFTFCYISSIGYNGFSINWNLTNPIYNLTESLLLSEGRHNISIEASNSTFTGNITNSTFFVDYSETINQSNGTETQYTPFYLILNKSSGLTISAIINFNGTQYSPSKTTGTDYDTYVYSTYLPLINRYWENISYFWNYSVTNGTDYSYGITHGNISTRKLIAYECNNATYGNYPFLNITYKDENTLTNVNTNSSIYITELTANTSSGLYRDYTLNYTGFYNNSICMYPNTTLYLNYSVVYKGQSYPQRTYSALNQILDSTTDLLTLYLLYSSDGIYARFRAMDIYSQPISGVSISMYESLSGLLIEQGTSDSAGIVTFWANPDKDYNVIFIKTGYTTGNLSIRPTSTDIYTFVMSSSTTDNESVHLGIKYVFAPSMQTLNNNSLYNFSFNLSSTYYVIEQIWYQLWNTTTMIANITNSTAYKYLAIEQNASNYSVITGRAIYQINGVNYTVSQDWRIREVFVGNGSLKNLVDDLENMNSIDYFTKGILAILFILVVILSLNIKYNALREVEPNLIIINLLVFFFSFIGWLSISGSIMGKYAILMLTIVASLIIFLNRYRYGGG